VNAVVLCETTKTPREVLLLTQQIERDMGRRKVNGAGLMVNGQRIYTDRIVDIDILLYDDLTIDEPDLKIPHPLMHQRDFVMIPLKEIQ
jgi:2-amino-4-hydroxy-6-hydroxymethyldihydropteridine diphosphokinase